MRKINKKEKKVSIKFNEDKKTYDLYIDHNYNCSCTTFETALAVMEFIQEEYQR